MENRNDKAERQRKELEAEISRAKQLATSKPGRYGGRYVARRYDRASGSDLFVTLEDDDPDTVADGWDVLAQVTPSKVYGIGHARNYIRPDGTVDYNY
jgi:hypothetical protein